MFPFNQAADESDAWYWYTENLPEQVFGFFSRRFQSAAFVAEGAVIVIGSSDRALAQESTICRRRRRHAGGVTYWNLREQAFSLFRGRFQSAARHA